MVLSQFLGNLLCDSLIKLQTPITEACHLTILPVYYKYSFLKNTVFITSPPPPATKQTQTKIVEILALSTLFCASEL